MNADDRLAEILARCNAAPPPPWTWEDWDQDRGEKRNTLQYVAPFVNDSERRLWGSRSPEGRPRAIVGCSDCGGETEVAAREFLAHVRDDVPFLLAQIDVLRAEVQRLNDALDGKY